MSACQSRIAALESELAAATTEHSARLAQQQKAFLAKLEQLRQVHVQQVAAASQEAQVGVTLTMCHAVLRCGVECKRVLKQTARTAACSDLHALCLLSCCRSTWSSMRHAASSWRSSSCRASNSS